jgi:hypothetical protein
MSPKDVQLARAKKAALKEERLARLASGNAAKKQRAMDANVQEPARSDTDVVAHVQIHPAATPGFNTLTQEIQEVVMKYPFHPFESADKYFEI